MITVTTSWDDGDAHDVRLADLLSKYRIRGTFYIARDQPNRLSETEIRHIALQHEVGAHTLTHPRLPSLTREGKEREIEGSKAWLESILGNEVQMFCYPYGAYDAESIALVKEAGFMGGRSSVKTLGTIPDDPYLLPVTMMAYRAPHTYLTRMLLVLRKGRVSNAEWLTRARKKVQEIEAGSGVFHLWGHSWEIEKLCLWESLEVFLKELASRRNVRFITNSELAKEARTRGPVRSQL